VSAWSKLVLLGVVVVAGAAYAGPDAPVPGDTVRAPEVSATAPSPLLQAAAHGDGDSWKDTRGQEYRLGMVNTPEVDECFGAASTAERQRLTAGGFRAEVYSTDRYGRGVSVVTLPDGRNLNVHLARQGFADDRYLEQSRGEHPALAAELDAAFAEARSEGRGLWSACRDG